MYRPLWITASLLIAIVVSKKRTTTNHPKSGTDGDELASASTTIAPAGSVVRDTPQFLQLATDNARKEYMDLENNGNLRLDVKQKAQDAWAVKNGEPVLTAYRSFLNDSAAAKAEELERMESAVQKLSQDAQKADSEIRAITANLTQTKSQMESAVQKKMAKLPKRVKNELTYATQ